MTNRIRGGSATMRGAAPLFFFSKIVEKGKTAAEQRQKKRKQRKIRIKDKRRKIYSHRWGV